MILVTSGAKYLDIDAYACCIAYAELLQLRAKDAQAISTAVLNKSITPSLRALPVAIDTHYQSHKDDTYVLVDLSDPDQFDTIVDLTQVEEVFDHHPGFEQYWSKKLGDRSHIEFLGAAATLIYEQWQQFGKFNAMSQSSAKLLAAAILDNTLNFGAGTTTQRDKSAYHLLSKHASLDDAWAAQYFSECQQGVAADLPKALQNDTKFLKFANLPEKLCVGQLAVWDASSLIANELPTIATTLSAMQSEWFVNIISISEGYSYFLTPSSVIQQWLHELLGVNFEGDAAKADKLWLRKEIIKAAQESSVIPV